jgi:hypothetical protein
VSERVAFVERLHTSPRSGVIAVTGGGALLLSDLLTVPGASATVLEANVPYAGAALANFIGAAPEQACSVETACDIAMAGWIRALALDSAAPQHRFGLGCTASLATTARKRGDHRVHIALQTLAETRTWSLTLAKGTRDRLTEERLVADIALTALAESFGIDTQLRPALRDGESIGTELAPAPPQWGDILLGRERAVPVNESTTPSVLFPGAFNPLHDGHLEMARYATNLFGTPVAFEICANNVDKPPLSYIALRRRIAQFESTTPVWITNTATFIEKARQFPGVRFVVGIDTLKRIADAKYYGGDPARLAAGVGEIADLGCRFLVFGRKAGNRFVTIDDVVLPAALRSLCTAVPEAEFRADISSTRMRRAVLDNRR